MEWIIFRFGIMKSDDTRIIKFNVLPSITFFEHKILSMKCSNLSFSWLLFEVKIKIKEY